MIRLVLLLAGCERPCASDVRWRDADGDGFGDPAVRSEGCHPPEGSATVAGDCDDGDPERFPGATETCDGRDQDCDDRVDDDPEPQRFVDADGDGFGDPDRPLPGCDAWGVEEAGDCDDRDPTLHPETRWFADADGDGVGGASVGEGCSAPATGAVRGGGDCDDADPSRFPGAAERCDGVDQDCVDAPEGAETWALPEAGVRVPLAVAPAPGTTLPLALDADLGAWLGRPPGPDPRVRLFVEDCGGALGERELPVQFLDGVRGVLEAGEGTDPPGDAVGALVALWDLDGDAATVEPWPAGPLALAVYVDVADGPPFASDLEVAPERLGAGGLVAALDPDAGGLLASLSLDGAPSVASQAAAARGNGVATPSGPLSVQDVPGALVVVDQGPVTAAVVATARLENASGSFDVVDTWRVFAGRPELLLRPRYVTDARLAIRGVEDRSEPIRPFEAAGRPGAACTSDPGLTWADLATASGGFTWSWVAPPTWVNFLGCDAASVPTETWTSANDLQGGAPGRGTSGNVPADTPIEDGPLLVLLPHGPGGEAAVRAAREAWRHLPVVEVGAPELHGSW